MNNEFENREAFRSFEDAPVTRDVASTFKSRKNLTTSVTGRITSSFPVLSELAKGQGNLSDGWYPISVACGGEEVNYSSDGLQTLSVFFDYKLYEQPNPTPEHSATSYKKSKRKLPPTHSTKPKTSPSKLLMKLLSQGNK